MKNYDEKKLRTLIDTKNPFVIENFASLNNELKYLDFEILNENLDKKIDFYSSEPFIFPESKENKSIMEFNKKFMDSKNTISIFMNSETLPILEIKIPKISNNLFGPLDFFIYSSISISKEYSKSGLMSHSYNRFYIHLIKGNSKIFLFSPKQEPYLYYNKNINTTHNFRSSSVNPWKLDSKKFPEYSKAGYIEINLTEGQIINIPPHWWFYIYENEDTLSLQYYSNNIYTKMMHLLS